MKEIKLTKGYVALVDDEDFELINSIKWFRTKNGYNEYAINHKRVNKKSKAIYMHRLVLGLQTKDSTIINPEIITDHINMNGLDNRKCNLRLANKSTNSMNRPKQKRTNTTKYKGVYKSKEKGRIKIYQAYINVNKKRIRLGWFLTAEEAAQAYNEAALKYHKEFARLNIIDGEENG